MRTILVMRDELAFTAYSITSLTAPTMGVILGGAMTHIVGGYTHPNALKLITWVSLLGTLMALPLPWLDDYRAFLSIFWGCLFIGGFIMPGMTGIMINAAPKKHRAIANSIAFFTYNALGYVPGPSVYGLILTYAGSQSRIGMAVLIYALILAFLFMWCACCGSSRSKRQARLRKLKSTASIIQAEEEQSKLKTTPESQQILSPSREQNPNLRRSLKKTFTEDRQDVESGLIGQRSRHKKMLTMVEGHHLLRKHTMHRFSIRPKQRPSGFFGGGKRLNRRNLSLFDREMQSSTLPGAAGFFRMQSVNEKFEAKEKRRQKRN